MRLPGGHRFSLAAFFSQRICAMKKVKLTGQIKKFLKYPLLFLLLLVAINIEIYMISTTAGLLMTAGIAAYALILFILSYRLQTHILEELISFATQYGQVQKQMIRELAVPYALTDEAGHLLWFNEEFERMTGRDSATYHKSIASLFNGLTADRFPARNEQLDYEILFNSRYYELQIRNIVLDDLVDSSGLIERNRGESQYIYAITLFDETDLKKYIRRYEDEMLVCGVMVLDNYDEALQSVEDVRRSLLTALIDRKITNYFQNADGIVCKYEKDKYQIVMRKRTLDELKESRFQILEDVKTVNIGNDMAVTMSIGIGVNQGSYNKNLENARLALDLALGRGGDQVVIRDAESITYYGGKSQAVEKSTRVKARIKAHALEEFIGGRQKVVVMGHKLLDIDAFGASIGIYRAARSLNKPAYIVVDVPNTSTQPFIDEFNESQEYDPGMFLNIHEAKEMVDNDTLLVVVDTSKPDYTECQDLLSQTSAIVVLDHHRQSNDCITGAGLSYIEPYASSTCEMVAEILQYFSDGVKLKPMEASAMYAGIMVDTDNFMNKTGVRTFEAAAFLRRAGADITRVRKLFRENINSFRAKGEALERAELYRDHFIISVCPSKNIESPTIVGSEAANQLLNIRGVRASFVLTEYRGQVYISARSIDEVNVQIIMEKLGGGGHLNMAGAQLDTSIDEARNRLKQVIDDMIQGEEI